MNLFENEDFVIVIISLQFFDKNHKVFDLDLKFILHGFQRLNFRVCGSLN